MVGCPCGPGVCHPNMALVSGRHVLSAWMDTRHVGARYELGLRPGSVVLGRGWRQVFRLAIDLRGSLADAVGQAIAKIGSSMTGSLHMDFTVLASGSSGNANLIRAGNFGLLIDVGLGPQRLGARLRTVGSSWAQVNAVLLTHVHGDHWKDRSLRFLRQNKIPLYCHADHEVDLIRFTPAIGHLRANKLLRLYQHDAAVVLE